MATLKEINYNIRNLIRGGILSDDERIAERQVDFIIHSVRALFIRQAADKYQYISASSYQTICLDLTIVDKSDCPEIQTDCFILRSTDKLPNLIRSNRGLLYQEISAIDGSISFPLIATSRSKWRSFNKFTATSKVAFIKNGYLYILNDILQEKASISGIFENPIEASNTSSCSQSTDEYPLSSDMVDGLTNYIIRNILTFPLILRTDEMNDANGLIVNNPKTVNNAGEERANQST